MLPVNRMQHVTYDLHSWLDPVNGNQAAAQRLTWSHACCRYDNEFSYATRVCGLIQYISMEDQK